MIQTVQPVGLYLTIYLEQTSVSGTASLRAWYEYSSTISSCLNFGLTTRPLHHRVASQNLNTPSQKNPRVLHTSLLNKPSPPLSSISIFYLITSSKFPRSSTSPRGFFLHSNIESVSHVQRCLLRSQRPEAPLRRVILGLPLCQ